MPRYIFNPPSGEIRHARRYVGSVRRAENGRDYVGRIREHTATAATANDAFREVAALAMGFANAAALRAHNSRIRADNRTRRTRYGLPPIPRAAVPQPPLPNADLIRSLQEGARAAGETPLTAEQIMASWIRRA
jgi:hypothetical protein